MCRATSSSVVAHQCRQLTQLLKGVRPAAQHTRQQGQQALSSGKHGTVAGVALELYPLFSSNAATVEQYLAEHQAGCRAAQFVVAAACICKAIIF